MPIIQEIEEIQENHHRNNHPIRRHADTGNSSQPLAEPPHQRRQNPKPNTNSGPRKLLFLFLRWVIMTCVLSLFLIFIGFAALVLLHFLLAPTAVRSRRRRLRHNRQSLSTANPTSSSSYCMQDLRDLLPHHNYSASEQNSRDCAICLEGFKEGELCRKLPDCSHLFHLNCVANWLVKVPNCPVCRTRVQLDSGASSGPSNSDDDWKFWWPIGA